MPNRRGGPVRRSLGEVGSLRPPVSLALFWDIFVPEQPSYNIFRVEKGWEGSVRPHSDFPSPVYGRGPG